MSAKCTIPIYLVFEQTESKPLLAFEIITRPDITQVCFTINVIAPPCPSYLKKKPEPPKKIITQNKREKK